jgi:hypothetical protein
MATDYVQQMKDVAQPHVPEPVQVVGLLQPSGSMGAVGLHYVSPLAAMLKRRSGNKKAGGLARNKTFSTQVAMIVFAGDKVYGFNASPKSRTWKVGDKVGEWKRSDVKFTTETGRVTVKVIMDVPSTEEHFELEAVTAMGGKSFHEPFLDAIATG